MWAVQLNSDGYVTNFQHCTLMEFSKRDRYKDPSETWVFIDRAASFWDADELTYFLSHPTEFYYSAEDNRLLRDYKDPGDWTPLS